MFGDFLQQFGLNFPLQSADVQGGLFGLNAPVPGDPSVGTAPLAPAAGGGKGSPAIGNPAAALPDQAIATPTAPTPAKMTDPAAPQPAQQSPLASPLAPGGGGFSQNQPQDNPAPAAGVGSQFVGGRTQQ